MAGYEVSVGRDLLPGLLSGQDGLAKLVEAVLNQIVGPAKFIQAFRPSGNSD